MVNNQNKTITVSVSTSALKIAMYSIAAAASLLYIIFADSFLPLSGVSKGTLFLIADIICPIVLTACVLLIICAAQKLSKRHIFLFSFTLSILIDAKYAYSFLVHMSSAGIFGITDSVSSILIVSALHIPYCAVICAVSYLMVHLLNKKINT